MEISERVELIFAHAASLHQSGRLRNTVYCLGDRIYILNQDFTVLLNFRVPLGDKPFAHPVSFEASDYDSQIIQERDGRVEFVIKEDEFIRVKSCKTPKYTPEQVANMFAGFGPPQGFKVVLPSTIRRLLDESLSHIEFVGRQGKLIIGQRNIYTGTLIKIERQSLGFDLGDEQVGDFGPLGMRTDDFMTLFAFADSVQFWFGNKDVIYVRSDDPKLDMRGVVSRCVYDELGGELDA